MGTETIVLMKLEASVLFLKVKLNDPLMGTETTVTTPVDSSTLQV